MGTLGLMVLLVCLFPLYWIGALWWAVLARPRRSTYVVLASARIPAAPDAVYSLLANYVDGHPRILPNRFSNLVVEQGGIGAGTVIRFDVQALGRRRTIRAAVAEPDPGRVLVERSLDGDGAVTTFTVEPTERGTAAHLVIATEMPHRRGLLGPLERAVTTPVLRSLYREELGRLKQVASVHR
jgi:hypothetical protein